MACLVPVVYPDVDDTRRLVPEQKPEPEPGPKRTPQPRRRVSAIQREVSRRLNDATFGARGATRVPSPPKTGTVEGVDRVIWDRKKTLALASHDCVYCNGLGLKTRKRSGEMQPCGCVLRMVFNTVVGRYRYIQQTQARSSYCTPMMIKHGREHKRVWSRANEEFCADFYLVAKRSLDGQEWKIFETHILARNDWRHCTRILGMDRGNFFHAVYRIQQKLGRIFMALRPYALFPIDEYFAGAVSEKTPD